MKTNEVEVMQQWAFVAKVLLEMPAVMEKMGMDKKHQVFMREVVNNVNEKITNNVSGYHPLNEVCPICRGTKEKGELASNCGKVHRIHEDKGEDYPETGEGSLSGDTSFGSDAEHEIVDDSREGV
jgi:hypothetical protein